MITMVMMPIMFLDVCLLMTGLLPIVTIIVVMVKQ